MASTVIGGFFQRAETLPDRPCLVTRDVSTMPARIRTNRSRWTRDRPWAQISFLNDAADAIEVEKAPREVEDALVIAHRASDTTSRRDALDRLYDSLAQRAMQRGRMSVPKRSDKDVP
jgi:hypothetical protein